MRAALLLALPACGPTPDPDRAAYLTALHAPPAEAAVACGAIADPVLLGECSTFAAADRVRAGGDGRATCAQIGHRGWRGACFFEIADAMQLRGEDARAACAEAGPLSDRCLAHALNRDGPEAAAQTPDADAMLRVLTGRARALGLTGDRGPDAARDVVAQHLAGRYRDTGVGPPWPRFGPGPCGTADAETCARAYRLVVKDAAGSPRPTAPCAAGAGLEAVEAAGLPGWSPELAPPAAAVWAGLCR